MDRKQQFEAMEAAVRTLEANGWTDSQLEALLDGLDRIERLEEAQRYAARYAQRAA